jgi:hypothetical protein
MEREKFGDRNVHQKIILNSAWERRYKGVKWNELAEQISLWRG